MICNFSASILHVLGAFGAETKTGTETAQVLQLRHRIHLYKTLTFRSAYFLG